MPSRENSRPVENYFSCRRELFPVPSRIPSRPVGRGARAGAEHLPLQREPGGEERDDRHENGSKTGMIAAKNVRTTRRRRISRAMFRDFMPGILARPRDGNLAATLSLGKERRYGKLAARGSNGTRKENT